MTQPGRGDVVVWGQRPGLYWVVDERAVDGLPHLVVVPYRVGPLGVHDLALRSECRKVPRPPAPEGGSYPA